MKQEIRLLDIIRRGRFGAISLGDSKGKIVQILGEPQQTLIPRMDREKLEVIAYQGFEFTFLKDSLVMFMNKSILKWDHSYNPQFSSPNEYFHIKSWSNNLELDLKFESLKQHLLAYSIPFIEKPFFDSMSLLIRDDLELQFFSPKKISRNPAEWLRLKPEQLEFRLGAIYCYQRSRSAAKKATGFSGLGRIGFG